MAFLNPLAWCPTKSYKEAQFRDAAQSGDRATVVAMLDDATFDHSAPDLQTGCTALHLLCISGQRDVFVLVRPKFTNLDVIDAEGNTPLMAASLAGQAELVDDLLDAGAATNIINEVWRANVFA
jgi:ankyrin repeat protein